MNFSALTQNKPLLFGVIGGIVLIIAMIIFFGIVGGKNSSPQDKIIKGPMTILTTDSIGKAIEIQALLAKQGIDIQRVVNGTKSDLILKDYTMSQRDRTLLAIVTSGLMDKNIGLEIFDKGDFTSSKEDKRIRLARAINGELSRLIRKIDPIEDASVFISIPEPTIFTTMKKPTTATVQVTIPSGDKLDRDKVRTITNLLMGSIQDLTAANISITDTNGNVYTSVMSAEDDMMTLLEENDQYMKNKIMVQLDRLLGKGNYVATVSTYLRQSPLEVNKIVYNPKASSVVSEQKFVESLGDKSQDKNGIISGVSSYIPGGMPSSPDSSSNRNYRRSAEELQYGVGKTQYSENKQPGMIEEISIAVTLDQGAMPSNMPVEKLKELVARAASPKVNAANVEIAFSEMGDNLLSSERPAQLPKPEESGNPWWSVIVIFIVALLGGLAFIAGRAKDIAQKQQIEINALAEKTEMQHNQLKEARENTIKLQNQVQNSITTQQPAQAISTLQQTISDIKGNIQDDTDEKEISVRLKSWIESTG